MGKACAHKNSPTSHIHEVGEYHTYGACGNPFTDKASLIMHFATDTGYVPYKYGICGAAYSHEVKEGICLITLEMNNTAVKVMENPLH